MYTWEKRGWCNQTKWIFRENSLHKPKNYERQIEAKWEKKKLNPYVMRSHMYNVCKDFMRAHISWGAWIRRSNNRTSYINIHFRQVYPSNDFYPIPFTHSLSLLALNICQPLLWLLLPLCLCCCSTYDKENVFSRRNEMCAHTKFEWTFFPFFAAFFLIMLKLSSFSNGRKE